MGQGGSLHAQMERDGRVTDCINTVNHLHADVGAANVMALKYYNAIGCYLNFEVVNPNVKFLFWTWKASGIVAINCRMSHFKMKFMRHGGHLKIPKSLTVRQFYVVFNLLRDIHEAMFTSPQYRGENVLSDDNDTTTTTPTTASGFKQTGGRDPQGYLSLGDEDDNECTICMDGENEVVLRCNHAFCEQCFLHWQRKSDSCPVCRQSISTAISLIDDKCFDEIALLSPLEQLRMFFLSLGKLELQDMSAGSTAGTPYPILATPTSSHSRSSPYSNEIVSHWTCGVCTFNSNSNQRSNCIVCGSHRGQEDDAERSNVAMEVDLQLAILLSME